MIKGILRKVNNMIKQGLLRKVNKEGILRKVNKIKVAILHKVNNDKRTYITQSEQNVYYVK